MREGPSIERARAKGSTRMKITMTQAPHLLLALGAATMRMTV
jgi:hypothetical protein